jgi:beta-xylosidase
MLPSPGAFGGFSLESASVASHPVIIQNDLPWEGECVEGPWLARLPGSDYLFMFYSGSMYNTPAYSVGVARAKGVGGPWEKKGDFILGTGGGGSPPFSGPGHCSVVIRDDGRSFMVYHAHVGYDEPVIDTARLLLMDEVELGEDGWPRMSGGGRPTDYEVEI